MEHKEEEEGKGGRGGEIEVFTVSNIEGTVCWLCGHVPPSLNNPPLEPDIQNFITIVAFILTS